MFLSGSESLEEEPERTSGLLEELPHVGLPPHLNVQSLFESGKDAHSTLAFIGTQRRTLPLNAPFADFQGNAGHIRVVPCGLRGFVRARDNLCLMWTEPYTQGAQR